MVITTGWYSTEDKRIIILKFLGDWDIIEYDAAIEESIRLLNSVSHPVALIIDLSASKGPSRSPEVFKKWQEAIDRWRHTETYANFWVSVQAKYWDYFLIWLLSRVYNPSSMEVASSAEDAYQRAIKRLNKEIEIASNMN